MSCILVVEDEGDLREMLSVYLSAEGFEIETTELVDQARDILANRRIDCVLLDVMLPDGNGQALLDEIRNGGSYGQMDVILMSALASANVMAARQAVPFLQKPFTFDDLDEALAQVDSAP